MTLADGEWHRMHRATPLLRGGVALIAVVAVLVANLRDRIVDLFVSLPGQGDDPVSLLWRHGLIGWVLLGVVLVIVLVVVFFRISWRAMTFRVTREAVELRSGVLFRQHRQTRLDRIQAINVHRPLFARIFGAARLEIVVAGHGGNLTLAYLGSSAAEQLRRDILGISVAVKQAEASGAQPGSTVDELLNRGIEEFITSPADLHPDAASPESIVAVHTGRLIGSLLASRMTVVLLVFIVAIVVGAVYSTPWLLVAFIPSVLGIGQAYSRAFTRMARYTVSGAEGGIRVGYGLMSTSSETLPAGAIHAVELAQPLLWRPFGWWRLRIARAGLGRQRHETQTILLPVGTVTDVERVLPLVLTGVDPAELALLVESATARRLEESPFTSAPRAARWLHPFSWRRIGYALTGDVIAMRRGIILRKADFVPLARAQSVALRQGPLQRALGLAGLAVHVVDGPVRPAVPALWARDAVELFERIARRAVELAAAERRR